MLEDNFKFLNNDTSYYEIIENDFWYKLKRLIKEKVKTTTKDGNIGCTKQGHIGNCWILSAINALSYCKNGQEVIKNALEYKKGYTIVHTICGDYVVKNSEIDLKNFNNKYSKGDDDMSIFELALEKIIDDYANKRIRIVGNISQIIKKTLKNTPSTERNSSTHLGHPGACFYFLTGIEPQVFTTKTTIKEQLKIFKTDSNKNIALCATSKDKFKDKIKDISQKNIELFSCHAYSIKKFDGENIIIINPHNSNKEIILSQKAFLDMFSNIQKCDLSLINKKIEYFSPKMTYNKFGKIEKTIEIDSNGYDIEYNYIYNKQNKLVQAKCKAQNQNGLYINCLYNFSKKENYIENTNKNTQIALKRYFKNNKLIKTFFGKIDALVEIPIEIGKIIHEYVLYQYNNLDIETILKIAQEISQNDFTSAFKYCK